MYRIEMVEELARLTITLVTITLWSYNVHVGSKGNDNDSWLTMMQNGSFM